MELLFLGITKLLGSSAVGTMFGGLMGFLNRKADLDFKRLEYEDRDKERAHELLQRELDAKLLKQEYEARVHVEEIKADQVSFSDSMNSQSELIRQSSKGNKMAQFSSFVRPFISLADFLISTVGAFYIVYYAFYVSKVKFSNSEMYELVNFVICWIAFRASASVGWWFAMRPGSFPQVRR